MITFKSDNDVFTVVTLPLGSIFERSAGSSPVRCTIIKHKF